MVKCGYPLSRSVNWINYSRNINKIHWVICLPCSQPQAAGVLSLLGAQLSFGFTFCPLWCVSSFPVTDCGASFLHNLGLLLPSIPFLHCSLLHSFDLSFLPSLLLIHQKAPVGTTILPSNMYPQLYTSHSHAWPEHFAKDLINQRGLNPQKVMKLQGEKTSRILAAEKEGAPTSQPCRQTHDKAGSPLHAYHHTWGWENLLTECPVHTKTSPASKGMVLAVGVGEGLAQVGFTAPAGTGPGYGYSFPDRQRQGGKELLHSLQGQNFLCVLLCSPCPRLKTWLTKWDELPKRGTRSLLARVFSFCC